MNRKGLKKMKPNCDEIMFIFEMRGFAYNFLKQIFCVEPTKNFLNSIYDEGEIIKNFPFINENPFIHKGAEIVDKFLNEVDENREREYENIHWDYTRLFIGPKRLLAPPWESAYLNREGLLFQEETLQVRKAYLKYCLVSGKYTKEAEDHIALELDFMYRLNQLTIEKIKDNIDADIKEILLDQKEFLENHLAKWIPSFTNTIQSNANTDFYRGISYILKGFIEIDSLVLEEVIKLI